MLLCVQEMEKGHPLFFYQVGKVCFLAWLFARGSEWTGLLLCSKTTQLLNGFQVEGQLLKLEDKNSPREFKSAICGNFVLMSVSEDFCVEEDRTSYPYTFLFRES